MLTEIELEKRMLSEGEEQFWAGVESAKAATVSSRQPAGAVLLRRSVGIMAEALEDWIKGAKKRPGPNNSLLTYFSLLPQELTAYLATRILLDGIAEQQDFPAMAGRIGSRLMSEYRLRYIKKKDPLSWADTWRKLSSRTTARMKIHGLEEEARKKDLLPDAWPAKDRMKLGAFLIELLRQSTGLIEVVNVPDTKAKRPRSRSVVLPTEETLRWMEDTNAKLSLNKPRRYPMIEAPLRWDSIYGGGYYTPELQAPLVRTTREQLDQLDAFATEIQQGLGREVTWLRAANVAQSVPWRVNAKVHAVLRELWDRGGQVAGLPARRGEEPPPMPPDHDMEARRAWRRLVRKMHVKRIEETSSRFILGRQLQVADELGDRTLYFPHFADFRGRLYPVGSGLNPQGNDIDRGLLEFADPGGGVDSDAMDWLAIHTANTFGFDKGTLDERIQWAVDHRAQILRVAEDPVNYRWWAEADEPWQFLAAAFEVARVAKGDRSGSRLPVQVDGSNNGLQVYAMLSRDPLAGAATNCLPADRPQDIYQAVADLTLAELRNAGTPEAEYALSLVESRWDRKAVKRPVMVLPYGGTFYSCVTYLQEWWDTQPDTRRSKETMAGIKTVAKAVWENMGNAMPGALKVMEWLREIAYTFASETQPLWWISPSGFVVRQEYPKRSSGRVKTALGDGVRFTRYRDDVPDTIDARRQANGFPPNYVHSLDASVLHDTTTRAADAGISNLRLVHDAFATTPDRIGDLTQIVRNAFADIFADDPLARLHEQLALQAPTGAVVPEPPARGLLDVDAARSSTYLFA